VLLLVGSLGLTAGTAYAVIGPARGGTPPSARADFSITSTSRGTTYPGGAATYEVTVTPRGGFTGTVSLSVSRLPAATGTFTRTEITGGSGTATLIVTTSSSTPLGDSRFLISGRSGDLWHAASPVPWLSVIPKPVSYFSLDLSSQSPAAAAPVASATYSVAVKRVLFPGPVTLAITSDLPRGVTASFSPSVVSGSGSTLTLTTSTSTPAGSYPFAIGGRSGVASSEAAGILDVSDGGVTSFRIAGSPLPGLFLYPGGAVLPVNLLFTNPNGWAITVQSVTTSVAGTNAAGCGAENFAVVQQLTAHPVVPAGSTRALQDLGVPQSRWPQLRMLDAGNQDACRSATVNLSFSGTAQG